MFKQARTRSPHWRTVRVEYPTAPGRYVLFGATGRASWLPDTNTAAGPHSGESAPVESYEATDDDLLEIGSTGPTAAPSPACATVRPRVTPTRPSPSGTRTRRRTATSSRTGRTCRTTASSRTRSRPSGRRPSRRRRRAVPVGLRGRRPRRPAHRSRPSLARGRPPRRDGRTRRLTRRGVAFSVFTHSSARASWAGGAANSPSANSMGDGSSTTRRSSRSRASSTSAGET